MEKRQKKKIYMGRKQIEGHTYPNHLYKHLEIFHLLRSSPAMLRDQPYQFDPTGGAEKSMLVLENFDSIKISAN